jgi:hypothetical protein
MQAINEIQSIFPEKKECMKGRENLSGNCGQQKNV